MRVIGTATSFETRNHPHLDSLTERPEGEGTTARALLAVAAVAVGVAIHLHDGEYSTGAIAFITLALACTTAAVWQSFDARAISEIWLIRTLGAGLAIQFALLLAAWPAGVDQQNLSPPSHVLYTLGLGGAAALVALGLFSRPASRARRLWFPLLLCTHFLLGVWMIRSSPDPRIDVFVFQRDASVALLHGRNPYVMTFPDIYHSTWPGHQPVYAPGLSVNDRLLFGFPYPPVSLYLSSIAYALARDPRYAQAGALTLAGLFIASSRPSRTAALAAALLLFTPRVFFILGRAWTEPLVVMLLAATVLCARRFPRLLPIALGLFLVSKQYLVFALPLTFLLLPRPLRWKDWGDLLWKSALTAAVATLPLALCNWHEFCKSTYEVQRFAPFRWDALSYLVTLAWHDGKTNRVWLAFVALIPALAMAIFRAARTPAGSAAALALVYLTFFAFNKQAFCNYYFFVIGALCCAVAR